MKIGIADAQARVRFSLRVLLEQQPGWLVVGEAADCDELMDMLSRHSPDLLLLDWDLPNWTPEALLGLLNTQHPALKIIAMSGQQELQHSVLHAGADAFACKADSPEKLLNQIRELENGTNATPTGDSPA